MIQSLRKHWHEFSRIPAGRRFQEVHKRRHSARGKQHAGRRTALLIAGAVLSIGGLALMLLPGPGVLVLAVGLSLLASESASMARMLDIADKQIEDFLHYLRRMWGQWSTGKRVLAVTIAALLLAGAAVGVWKIFM